MVAFSPVRYPWAIGASRWPRDDPRELQKGAQGSSKTAPQWPLIWYYEAISVDPRLHKELHDGSKQRF
eukprot:1414821-Pyramimonas_sp.AAC.1